MLFDEGITAKGRSLQEQMMNLGLKAAYEQSMRWAYKKSQEDDPIKSFADPIKSFADPIKSFADPIKERLYQAVLQNGTLNYAEYAAIVGTSEATVKRRLGELKKKGAIIRVGSNKTGHWEINKEK